MANSFDKDMTTIKWFKNIWYNNIRFTNIIIEGSKIIVGGLSAKLFDPATLGFLASFDSNDGSLIANQLAKNL